MKLTFLGSSSGQPSLERNVSATALTLDDGQLWLFDCGEGTQHQFMRCNDVKQSKITKIFLTHLHGDHCFGLPGLMCTMSGNNPPSRTHVDIYGPLGLARWLRTSLVISDSYLNFKFQVHEIVPPEVSDEAVNRLHSYAHDGGLHANEEPPVLLRVKSSTSSDNNSNNNHYFYEVYEDAVFKVKCAPILHRIFCVGYVIKEKKTPGMLDISILKKKGVPPGPMYGQIKSGQSITLPSGEVIHPSDCVGPPKKGRKLVYLGDTYDPSGIRAIAMNADMLVHETTLEDKEKDMAIAKGHSCPSMAGEFAKSICAEALIITHFSVKYKRERQQQAGKTASEQMLAVVDAESAETTIADLLEEAKCAFGNDSVQASEDFKTFAIPKRQ